MKSLQQLVLGVAMLTGAVAGCDGENTGGGYYGGGTGPSAPNAGGSKAVQTGVGGVRSNNSGTGVSTSIGEATISCTMSVNGKLSLCLTAPGTEEDCTSDIDTAAGQSAQVVSKCPSGTLLTCPAVGGDDAATLYFYDQATVDALKMQSSDPCSAFE